MNKAQNGSNGHAANSMQNVLAEAKVEQQAAQVMDQVRNFLPKLTGNTDEEVSQKVHNFLEEELQLTRVKVRVTDFGSEIRVYPSFSLNGSTIEHPGNVAFQKTKIAAAVYA
jgi:hypothetical protein